jgi:hypothetical protein
VEPLIRPEPTEDERRVILAVLEAEPSGPAAYESGWREAALEEGVAGGAPDDPDAGAPATGSEASRTSRPVLADGRTGRARAS